MGLNTFVDVASKHGQYKRPPTLSARPTFAFSLPRVCSRHATEWNFFALILHWFPYDSTIGGIGSPQLRFFLPTVRFEGPQSLPVYLRCHKPLPIRLLQVSYVQNRTIPSPVRGCSRLLASFRARPPIASNDPSQDFVSDHSRAFVPS